MPLFGKKQQQPAEIEQNTIPPKQIADIDDLVYDTKFKGKEFSREAERFKKQAEVYRAKAAEAIKSNNIDSAKVFAQQSCTFQQQESEFCLLASQMDTASSELKQATYFKGCEKNISQVSDMLKNMDLDPSKIMMHMQQFQDATEVLNVNLEAINIKPSTVVNSNADNLINELQAELAVQGTSDVQPEIVGNGMSTLAKQVNAI